MTSAMEQEFSAFYPTFAWKEPHIHCLSISSPQPFSKETLQRLLYSSTMLMKIGGDEWRRMSGMIGET